MRTIAIAAVAWLAAILPATSQVYDCVVDTMCEGQDCQTVDMPMILTIEGEHARLGPPGDELLLRPVPMETARLQAFAADDGIFAIFASLSVDLGLVLTMHMPQSLLRYSAMTGRCEEAR